jgi:predicted ATPase/DNA-binding CsgD family transcriptional regulator
MADLLDPVSPFIGRVGELAVLECALRDPSMRLLTLTGTGGSGKTRLALRSARHVACDFPGGVIVVSLAPISGAQLVVPTVARVLGLREGGGDQLEQRVATALGTDRTLLLLDNFEHVIDAAPFVSFLLQTCPQLVVLVTSRMRLRIPGEREQVVPPLPIGGGDQDEPPSEAALLFHDRMAAIGAGDCLGDTDARAIEEICIRLDGLPLAVELAAAWSKVLTPMQLLDHLEPRLPMLVSGHRDAPARHQTVRATIQWSYDLLTPDEQTLFRWLGVFRGGFALDSVEVIAGQNEVTGFEGCLLDTLAALVEKSLLVRSPTAGEMPRFTMLETLREFAADALAETGELTILQQRHTRHFVELAERIGPFLQWQQDTQGSIARLDEDQDNMRAALVWAAEHDQIDGFLRLVASLQAYWTLRGKLHEARQWLERALPIADTASPWLRGMTVRACAWNSRYLSDCQRADTLGQLAFELASEAGDRFGALHALTVLGFSAHEQRHYERAIDLFETVRARALDLGAPIWVAWATRNIGRARYEMGEMTASETLLQQAIVLFVESGCPYGATEAQAGLAQIAFERGQYARAARHWVDRMGSGWDEPGLRIALEGLIEVTVSLGEWAWAARLLGAAEVHRERLGVHMRPAQRQQLDRTVERVHAGLDQSGFMGCWAEGRRCSADDARALAITFADAMTSSPIGSISVPCPALSRREREILQLVAAGQTNRQIADALFISVPTVKRHLTTAYGKLGVDSRVEAAALFGAATPG